MITVYRNTYSTQGRGALIHIQFRYTAILIGAGMGFKKKLLIELFSHWRKLNIKVLRAR